MGICVEPMGDCMASTTEDGADWAELWFDPGPTGTVGVPLDAAADEDSDSFLLDSLIFLFNQSFRNPGKKKN